MPGPGGRDFQQAYNCQAVVDHAHQVIMAARATNQTSDQQQAVVMIEETIRNTGVRCPGKYPPMLAITRQRQSTTFQALGVDAFVAPEQTRHGRVVPPAPRGRIPEHLSPRDRMRRKLQTRRGRQRYALRMADGGAGLRPDQGRAGASASSCCGDLEKVNGEWSLICTGHNLLKLFRCGRLAPG